MRCNLCFYQNFLEKKTETKPKSVENVPPKNTEGKKCVSPSRIGQLGEYKINIQLDQFPKDWKHLDDLLIENLKSKSGYSQIDHVVITPYGLFVIEIKNYAGRIIGKKQDKKWTVNGKFNMYNPLHQNYGHIKALQKHLQCYSALKFFSVVSFTRRCTLNIDQDLRSIHSDELVVFDTELSETIQRKINIFKVKQVLPSLSGNDILNITEILKKNNAVDENSRENHVENVKKAAFERTAGSECCICGKKVSDKVHQYCLNNEKFKGKVYCFNHQNKI